MERKFYSSPEVSMLELTPEGCIAASAPQDWNDGVIGDGFTDLGDF